MYSIRISSACTVNTMISPCHLSCQSNLCFGSRRPLIRSSDQKIFYFFRLAYFNPNIVQSFAVTKVNFILFCICCKPESFLFNLLLFSQLKKSMAHSPWSIQTAILSLVIIIGASIFIDFLPDRAIIYLFTLS